MHKMRKSNNKLNFMKNGRAICFSHGQLKISKCSISLAQMGKCSKSKVAPLIVVYICPSFQMFCQFLPFFLLFFRNIACMPLLSRIGPASLVQWSLKWRCRFIKIILTKDAGHWPASLLKFSFFCGCFFTHFASKNQWPGFSINGTLFGKYHCLEILFTKNVDCLETSQLFCIAKLFTGFSIIRVLTERYF